MPDPENIKGKVKWYDNKRGYGFIAGEGGKDVFLHHTQIVGDGYKTLAEGEEVLFDIVNSDKGPKARKVRRIKQTEQSESRKDQPRTDANSSHEQVLLTSVSPPAIIIVWDPTLLDPTDYA